MGGAGLIGHTCMGTFEILEYRQVARHTTATSWPTVVPSLIAGRKLGARGGTLYL